MVEVKVPFRELTLQLEERLQRVELYKDLPTGRKRPGWKKEFMASLKEAAREMGDVSPQEVLKTVRRYRNEKKQRSPLKPSQKRRGRRVVVDTSVVISGISAFKGSFTPGRNPSADNFLVTLNSKDFPPPKLTAKVVSRAQFLGKVIRVGSAGLGHRLANSSRRIRAPQPGRKPVLAG